MPCRFYTPLICRRAQRAAQAAAEPLPAGLPARQLCDLHRGVRLRVAPPLLPHQRAQKRGDPGQGDGPAVAQRRHLGSLVRGEFSACCCHVAQSGLCETAFQLIWQSRLRRGAAAFAHSVCWCTSSSTLSLQPHLHMSLQTSGAGSIDAFASPYAGAVCSGGVRPAVQLIAWSSVTG